MEPSERYRRSLTCHSSWALTRTAPARRSRTAVACHEHGTAVSGFLPVLWDHLDCQSWDRPARHAGRPWVHSFDHRVVSEDVEVSGGGVQGGRRGRGA